MSAVASPPVQRPPRPRTAPPGRGGVLGSRPAARLLAAVVLLALWQAASAALGESVLPAPTTVVATLAGRSTTADLWSAVGATAASTLVGLAIAVVLAVPLGLAAGRDERVLASTRLPVDFLRTIPPVVLVPLVVLLYGPTTTMKVVLVVFGAFWPLFLQATYAVREVDPVVRDMTRAFGLSRRVVWAWATLPSALPFLMTGLRVATTIALLLSIAGELIGNAPGIGREIALAQLGADTPGAYAYVTVAALLGVAVNLLTGAAQRRLLFWHPSYRGAR